MVITNGLEFRCIENKPREQFDNKHRNGKPLDSNVIYMYHSCFIAVLLSVELRFVNNFVMSRQPFVTSFNLPRYIAVFTHLNTPTYFNASAFGGCSSTHGKLPTNNDNEKKQNTFVFMSLNVQNLTTDASN